ncbi:unnamed protein product [Notodromas monacha]|uniref:AGC-kinase C-terminal domain-containing protein n=1 Tax=Notodromas monacha TaxID=399045 RepID=A0A7R9BN88_9CRUS|nr:unnamed protein product [Notodromas monacha]CAG0917799.1 unnamed protein product [Notodromas monacha]
MGLTDGQLEQKQVSPPYKPRLDNDRDLANFPPEFTDEPVQLTPDDPGMIYKRKQMTDLFYSTAPDKEQFSTSDEVLPQYRRGTSFRPNAVGQN